MPQMSPLNWTILFIYFLIMLFLVSMKIYFINYPTSSSSEKMKKNSIKTNIKWQW